MECRHCSRALRIKALGLCCTCYNRQSESNRQYNKSTKAQERKRRFEKKRQEDRRNAQVEKKLLLLESQVAVLSDSLEIALKENSLLMQSNSELKDRVQTLEKNLEELEREHKHILEALHWIFKEYEKVQTLNDLLVLQTKQLELMLEAEKKQSEAAEQILKELRERKEELFVTHLRKHP
jgi:hypothetical protein